MKICEVNNPGPPVCHLGCNYSKFVEEGEEFWCIGTSTHIEEALVMAEKVLSKLIISRGVK